jgi:LytS/YehU family sensor histidine kinase
MPGPPPPPSAHFVNNVLAAAAGLVDEDPGQARDVLAELGQFLAYRLRTALDPVPLADELAALRSLLALEAARFPGRLRVELPGRDDVPACDVVPLSVLEPLHEALTRRMGDRPGGVRVAVRLAGRGARVRVDLSDHPTGEAPERVVVDLAVAA